MKCLELLKEELKIFNKYIFKNKDTKTFIHKILII